MSFSITFAGHAADEAAEREIVAILADTVAQIEDLCDTSTMSLTATGSTQHQGTVDLTALPDAPAEAAVPDEVPATV